MAGGTSHFDVRAIKWIVTLPGVIKIPGLPAPGVVTGFALPTKGPFVNIIAVVTFGAKRRRILVSRCLMAGFTLRARVSSRQFEFRFVVVVRDSCPFFLVVAVLTFIAELALVRIIFAVARQTIARQRFGTIPDIQRTGMTCGAFGGGMLIPKRIFGRFGMIESRWLPALVVVTGIARFAV